MLFTCADYQNCSLVKIRPILVQETFDMHRYTRHSGLAIINWIVASTDGAKNCQEKESWVLHAFHEVGEEGHTLDFKVAALKGFLFSEKLADEVSVPRRSRWIISSRLCHSMGEDTRAAMWVEEEARWSMELASRWETTNTWDNSGLVNQHGLIQTSY